MRMRPRSTSLQVVRAPRRRSSAGDAPARARRPGAWPGTRAPAAARARRARSPSVESRLLLGRRNLDGGRGRHGGPNVKACSSEHSSVETRVRGRRRSSAGRPPRPPHHQRLQRQPRVERPARDLAEALGRARHVQVRREHRGEQRDQPEPRRAGASTAAAPRRRRRSRRRRSTRDDRARHRPAGAAARSARRRAASTKWFTPAPMKNAASRQRTPSRPRREAPLRA